MTTEQRAVDSADNSFPGFPAPPPHRSAVPLVREPKQPDEDRADPTPEPDVGAHAPTHDAWTDHVPEALPAGHAG